MINRESTGLENLLTAAATDEFLQRISQRRRRPTLELLTELLRACFKHVPFQNMMMLTGPRRPPSLSEIADMMLRGLGGACDVNNLFFAALLHQLGFKVGLLSASMQQPNCHIGLLIHIGGQKYWTDYGNGFPYLTPLPATHHSTARHLGFNYALRVRDDCIALCQNPLGARRTIINQTFTLKEKHYSYFNAMRARHYQEPGFGPFLSGVRINRWELTRGFIMRDEIFCDMPGKFRRADRQTREDWIKQNFNGKLFIPLYRQSLEALNANN